MVGSRTYNRAMMNARMRMARRALQRLPAYVRSISSGRGGRPFYTASRSVIAARIHTFKRIGQGFILNNSNTAGALPDINTGGQTSSAAGISVGNLTAGPVANTISFGGAITFSLAQLANASELTSLFDNYRIKKIVLRGFFSADGANVPTGTSAATTYSNAPIMHYAYDPDDGSIPSTDVSLMQNSYCKSLRLTDMFTISLSPRVQSTVSANPGASTTAGGLLNANQWLDCDAPNVFHYGLKFYVSGWPSQLAGNAISLRFIPTFYVEGKNIV